MSPVIKSADAGASHRVRPLRLQPNAGLAPVAPVDAERLRLSTDLEQAIALIQARDVEIERLQGEVERAARDGEAEGRAAGLRAATDRQDERLGLLQAGIGKAVELVSAELASLERLAPLLASEGLERLIGDAGHRGDLLRALIAENVGRLDADSIVRVEISAADFPDPAPLAEIVSSASQQRVEVRQAPDLKSGDCRIRLVLGELEVGINQQWDRLSQLYQELSLPEAAE